MKRMVHLDLLRILACFSVVMLHSSAIFWYDRPVASKVWLIANSYDALSRYGVPIFVMISGALFLSEQRQLNIKRLYAHNIVRLIAAYVVWSCLYGLLSCQRAGGIKAYEWKDVVRAMLYGRYHLWFLPMLVGIYMLLPVLRSWVSGAQKKNLQYFLVLFFVMQICRSTLLALAVGRKEWTYLLNIPEIEMVCSYIGYFILGYYIMHIGIEKRWHKWIYGGGIAGAVLDVALSTVLSIRANEPRAEIYDCYSLFTFSIIVAIFLFFTTVVSQKTFSERTEKIVGEISASTMGIYIMHVGLLELLQNYFAACSAKMVVWIIPLLACFCFAVCGIVSALFRRIPLLRRII